MSALFYSILNHISTDPPENARLVLTRRGQSVTITCTADGRPEPSYEIFFNCDMLVKSDKTYRLHEVNTSHVGLYKCVARNILGQSSAPKYFSLIGKITYSNQVKVFIIFS